MLRVLPVASGRSTAADGDPDGRPPRQSTAAHPGQLRASLESLREYVAEKLRDADEELIFQVRHRDWFLALAERAAPELGGPCQQAWLDHLDRERENQRAAQRWAVAKGDAETAARLGAALWRFWWARADAAETRKWISTIAPLVRQAQPTRVLAQAPRSPWREPASHVRPD